MYFFKAYLSEKSESPASNMSNSELLSSGLISVPTILLICKLKNSSRQMNASQRFYNTFVIKLILHFISTCVQ